MPCEHLKQLYELCDKHELQLSSSELIRIMCPHCEVEEVCPSVYLTEYEARKTESGDQSGGSEE